MQTLLVGGGAGTGLPIVSAMITKTSADTLRLDTVQNQQASAAPTSPVQAPTTQASGDTFQTGQTQTPSVIATPVSPMSTLARLPDGDYELPITRTSDRSYRTIGGEFRPSAQTETGSLFVRKRGDEILARVRLHDGSGTGDGTNDLYGFKHERNAKGEDERWLVIDASGRGEGGLYGRDPYLGARRGPRAEIYGRSVGVWLEIAGDVLKARFSDAGKTIAMRGSTFSWSPPFTGTLRLPPSAK